MVITGIGIQQILPRTGIGGQGGNPAPDQNNDCNGSDACAKPERVPASPGTGQIVDIKV